MTNPVDPWRISLHENGNPHVSFWHREEAREALVVLRIIVEGLTWDHENPNLTQFPVFVTGLFNNLLGRERNDTRAHVLIGIPNLHNDTIPSLREGAKSKGHARPAGAGMLTILRISNDGT